MKSFKIIAIFALTLLLMTGGGIAGKAEAVRHLKIINNSGETIYQIYAVSTSYNGWGKDILNTPSTLQNGYYQIVEFSDNVRYVKVRTYFSGGRYKYWNNIDLNKNGTITVTRYKG